MTQFNFSRRLLPLIALLLTLLLPASTWATDVTYTVTSKSAVSTSGTAPSGSSATFANTYNTKDQLTRNNTMTLTLSGFAGQKITGITLSMHSNGSAGAGYLSVKAGSTTLASIGSSSSGVAFNNASWNGSYTTTYTNVTPTMSNSNYTIQAGENVVIVIGATTNSLFCQSFKISYEDAGAPTLSSIAVKTAPTKTTYMEGEKFDPTGLVITKTLSNATTADVAYSGNEDAFTFNPSLTTELSNETSVTITYGGKTTAQAITVNPFAATAGTYTINTNNGLYGVSTGNNGTEQSTTKSGITIVSGCKSSATSKTYYDTDHIRYYTDSYLKLTAPTGFEITKVVFTANGTWNSGPKCGSNGSYNNSTKTWEGSTSQLDLTFSDQNRIKSIAVTYSTSKALQTVTVSGTPTKTTYNVGDAFETAGLVVTATYSDDSQEAISTGFNWTIDYGTDNTALVAGATSVNVKVSTDDEVESEFYTVNGLTVIVPVTLTSIAVSGTPTKTDYYVGDAFDPAGLVVTGTYSDGTTAPITEGIDWNIVPATLNAGATSVSVTATVSSVTSGSYIVNGLTVTANPYQTATISSFSATSGDINSAITYEAFKSNASTAPYINADLNALRLYQNGGYVTITALTGLKIASVKITTSATYESTTVGYCVDDEDAPTTGEIVAKSSDYTISNLNNKSVSIYCLGTDKNTRLEIAAIEVKYSGNVVVELKNIALSGTYPTEFNQGDAFSHEGMTVTANYTDETNADVTSSATFLGYDMSTLGEQTVTVSYTEDEITKTAQYQITVNKAPFVPTPAPNGYEAVNFTTIEPYASLTGSQSANVEDYEGSSFSMAFAKPQSSSTPTKYYNSGASVRAYKDNTITITGAENITNVDIAWVTGYVDDAVSITGLGTTTTVVTFSKTCRFTSITVHYLRYSRENVKRGSFGTICLPYAVSEEVVAASGFTFYNIASKTLVGESLKSIALAEQTSLEAGVPYLFEAPAGEGTTTLILTPANATIVSDVDNKGGLVGTLTGMAMPKVGTNPNAYFVSTADNKLHRLTGTATATIGANKAYIDLTDVPEAEPTAAPARVIYAADFVDQATGLNELNTATIQNFFQNGQVYILREGRLYDVTGRLVK